MPNFPVFAFALAEGYGVTGWLEILSLRCHYRLTQRESQALLLNPSRRSGYKLL